LTGSTTGITLSENSVLCFTNCAVLCTRDRCRANADGTNTSRGLEPNRVEPVPLNYLEPEYKLRIIKYEAPWGGAGHTVSGGSLVRTACDLMRFIKPITQS